VVIPEPCLRASRELVHPHADPLPGGTNDRGTKDIAVGSSGINGTKLQSTGAVCLLANPCAVSKGNRLEVGQWVAGGGRCNQLHNVGGAGGGDTCRGKRSQHNGHYMQPAEVTSTLLLYRVRIPSSSGHSAAGCIKLYQSAVACGQA
jgi:hypothetical protein